MTKTRQWHPEKAGHIEALKSQLEELRKKRHEMVLSPKTAVRLMSENPSEVVTYDEIQECIINPTDPKELFNVCYLKKDTDIEEFKRINDEMTALKRELNQISDKEERGVKKSKYESDNHPETDNPAMILDIKEIQAAHDKKLAEAARERAQKAVAPEADDTQKVRLTDIPKKGSKKKGLWNKVKSLFKR